MHHVRCAPSWAQQPAWPTSMRTTRSARSQSPPSQKTRDNDAWRPVEVDFPGVIEPPRPRKFAKYRLAAEDRRWCVPSPGKSRYRVSAESKGMDVVFFNAYASGKRHAIHCHVSTGQRHPVSHSVYTFLAVVTEDRFRLRKDARALPPHSQSVLWHRGKHIYLLRGKIFIA